LKTNKNNFTSLLSLTFFVFISTALNSQSIIDKIHNYIQKNKEYAIEQMVLFKIPASVTMAQAIKESDYGNSELAKESNNHFGIKCHKEWGGNSFIMDDDTLNECFRKYNSVEESFFDHSMFLKSRPRYDFLFKLPLGDYSGWCAGLKEAGYATSFNYTNDLLIIIDFFNLHELDKVVPLNNSLKLNELLVFNEKNIIPNEQNYFETAEKHILAKVIFNIYDTEEEPLFVRGNSTSKKAD
jgi:flagellum-specific peptidoglycan hydrolase FlgJ